MIHIKIFDIYHLRWKCIDFMEFVQTDFDEFCYRVNFNLYLCILQILQSNNVNSEKVHVDVLNVCVGEGKV